MAKQNIGTVKTATGSEYYCFWDTESGDVYVGSEHAGRAVSKEEAWRKGNYYATTLKKMK
jgi:hypothetical protein